MSGEETKQCPFCAEHIKTEAKICRFCHLECATGKLVGSKDSPIRLPTEIHARSNIGDGVKLGIGMFIVLPILIAMGVVVFITFFAVVDSQHTSPLDQAASRTREDIGAHRNLAEHKDAARRGWNWGKANSVADLSECDELLDPDERIGCKSYEIGNKRSK